MRTAVGTRRGGTRLSGFVRHLTSRRRSPVALKADKARFIRGGGWSSHDPSRLRCAVRYGNAPSLRDAALGFRPVLDSPKEKP